MDSNFRSNGITSIIKYNKFTSIPFIKKDSQKNNQAFVSDIDLLQVFAKPLVKNVIFKNKYKSLHLDEVGKALLGYGKLNNKTGAKLEEMSIDERKSYCSHDAHIVADLVRVNNGDILKIMQVIASHTGLKFEEVCHKGMTGIWKKILDEAISKKIAIVGYDNIPATLSKLYCNKTSYTEYRDVNCYDEGDEEDDEELLEYRENLYEQYIELLEQKAKERSFGTDEYHNSSNVQLNRKERGDNSTKQVTIRKYKGGTVLPPQRGLHFDVCVFDVTSLYPTMIINHDVSPATVNCPCCRNDFKARAMFDKHILKDCHYVSKKDDDGYWICQRKRGLFSRILQELTEKRKRYKNEGKDIESIAIKAIINSGYGVFGHPHFKYYDPRAAELITALGRQTLLKMQKVVSEMGFAVLYGDTDSLFVNNIKDNEDIHKFIDTCKIKLNVEVSHEKTLRKLILVGKKHYVGFLSDQTKEPVVKGMEGIKSDRPEFIQTVFKEMIEDIKNNTSPIPKLKHALNELDTRQVPNETLAISLVINKNPHEYANDCLQKRLGTKNKLEKGDLLVYYKCDKKVAVTPNPLEKERIRNVGRIR